MQPISDMQVNHGASKYVAGIVHCNPYIRSYVAYFIIFKRDCVLHHLFYMLGIKNWLLPVCPLDFNVIKQKQGCNISAGLSAIYRSLVAEFIQVRDKSAMVHVSVA